MKIVMREIKFRGFNRKNNEWLYGFYLQNRGAHFVCPDEFAIGKSWDDYEIDPDTLGQFTGLHDKKGNEIYEGDVVRIYDSDYEKYSVQQVKFAHGVFGVDNWTKKILTTLSFFMGCDSEYSVEVIGNIHDHPSLLQP